MYAWIHFKRSDANFLWGKISDWQFHKKKTRLIDWLFRSRSEGSLSVILRRFGCLESLFIRNVHLLKLCLKALIPKSVCGSILPQTQLKNRLHNTLYPVYFVTKHVQWTWTYFLVSVFCWLPPWHQIINWFLWCSSFLILVPSACYKWYKVLICCKLVIQHPYFKS